MAGKARNPSIDEKVRHLEELVRRLGTRLPPAAAVTSSSWSPATGDFNTAAGWYRDGSPYLTFYRQGDLVTVIGLFGLAGGAVLTDRRIWLAGTLPTAFRPASITRLLANETYDPSRAFLYSLYLQSDGLFEISQSMHGLIGTPAPLPWADITDGGYHSLNVMASYPAGELGLGLGV